MSGVKIGDWIEIVEIDVVGKRCGIAVGDAFIVKGLLGTGHAAVELGKSKIWWLSPGLFKKAEPLPVQTKALCTPLEHGSTKKERVASSHYQNANNNDVWQFVDDNLSAERVKGFHQTNAIKYVTRYHVKHDTTEKRIEDLEKAKVCIDKLIELERLDCGEDIDREG